MMNITRRSFGKILGGTLSCTILGCASEIVPKTNRRVVIVGAGFGGMTAGNYIHQLDPSIEVIFIERNNQYVANPFSNEVLVGRRQIGDLTLTYPGSQGNKKFLHTEVTDINPNRQQVLTPQGRVSYDALILATGIDFSGTNIEGYDEKATPLLFPHGWQGGEQTLLLQRQIQAMGDGGVIIVSIPQAPYRCPAGPYERVCLLAEYLKAQKPRSKLLVLDGNRDIVALPKQFKAVWQSRYPHQIEYLPDSTVVGIHSHTRSLITNDGSTYEGEVINLIPPQGAGPLARLAGLVEKNERWCAVNGQFESIRQPHIYVLGDAAKVGDMPKTAYGANVQGKLCALNVVAKLNNLAPMDFPLLNVCYGSIGTNEAISIAQVFRNEETSPFKLIPGAGSSSPLDMSLTHREYINAEGWLANMLAEFAETT